MDNIISKLRLAVQVGRGTRISAIEAQAILKRLDALARQVEELKQVKHG